MKHTPEDPFSILNRIDFPTTGSVIASGYWKDSLSVSSTGSTSLQRPQCQNRNRQYKRFQYPQPDRLPYNHLWEVVPVW